MLAVPRHSNRAETAQAPRQCAQSEEARVRTGAVSSWSLRALSEVRNESSIRCQVRQGKVELMNQTSFVFIQPSRAILKLNQHVLGAILLHIEVDVAIVRLPPAVIEIELRVDVVHYIAQVLCVLQRIGK